MAEAKYAGNKLRVTNLPQGLELTGPQAHGLVYLWTGIGSKPDKRTLTSLKKMRLLENIESEFPTMTRQGKEVTRDLLPLFQEED
jgi:hypothetical protein